MPCPTAFVPRGVSMRVPGDATRADVSKVLPGPTAHCLLQRALQRPARF